MILYLDASALVKRYIKEDGSDQVMEAMKQADMVSTAIITRAEIAAALARSVRMSVLKKEDAFGLLVSFRKDWADFIRLDLSENTISRADNLAWDHQLRGYDSVHLACALFWQEAMDQAVTFATYDQQLWRSAERLGLIPFPTDLVKLKK